MSENQTGEQDTTVDTDETTEDTGGVSNETPEPGAEQTEEEPETFPRAYVEELRRESAGYRDKAKRTDELGQRLHLALVTATGKLADPSDLAFDEAHLEDPEALTAAVDELVARKPHLKARRVSGDIGQGVGTTGQTVDLAGLLRSRAS